jgi:hypothetical protein
VQRVPFRTSGAVVALAVRRCRIQTTQTTVCVCVVYVIGSYMCVYSVQALRNPRPVAAYEEHLVPSKPPPSDLPSLSAYVLSAHCRSASSHNSVPLRPPRGRKTQHVAHFSAADDAPAALLDT